jgi:hypothetical protein
MFVCRLIFGLSKISNSYLVSRRIMNPLEYLLSARQISVFFGWHPCRDREARSRNPGVFLKVLSLYLLFALGFKGGNELQKTTFSPRGSRCP